MTTIGIIVVLVLALIFMVMLVNRLKGDAYRLKGSAVVQDQYTEANLNNAVATDGEAVPPAEVNEQGVIPGTPVLENIDYPEKIENVDFRPIGDSVEQPEQVIKVGKLGFEPKEVGAVSGAKVILTFDAIDEGQHKVVFTDSALSFLSFSFAKKDGAMTRIFPAPAVGDYNFYIDSEDNSGSFKVVSK